MVTGGGLQPFAATADAGLGDLVQGGQSVTWIVPNTAAGVASPGRTGFKLLV